MPSIIKKRVTAYLRVLTGRQNAARGLTVYPDDTFLVSFPRSGNTWIRFLVGNLLSPDDPVSFATLEVFVLGLGLGWLRVRAGSIVPGMVTHAGYDIAVGFLSLIAK